MVAERRRWLALAMGLWVALACADRRGPVSPDLEEVARRNDALSTSDALEALIADGKDTPADRTYAYGIVCEREENSAAYAFARAAVTGRLVQQRGLLGATLVPDVERWAQRSRMLDEDFRDGAATRLLGTLYVVAPANLLSNGDSEEGLSLLEGLTRKHPDTPENHLRLAEAYIALGDPGPAAPHLCFSLERRAALRNDDRQLLDQLIATSGQPACLAKP
jgi:hypothetical protein